MKHKKEFELIECEHRQSVEDSPTYPVPKIRKCKTEKRFFCYWFDGEIEYRDTYVVDQDSATIEAFHRRHRDQHNWICSK